MAIQALPILKGLASRLILKKIEEEVTERISNEGIESEVKKLKKTYKGVSKKKSASWVAISVVLLTIAQSQGWIDSSLAQALLDLVQNPDVQDAVNNAVSEE